MLKYLCILSLYIFTYAENNFELYNMHDKKNSDINTTLLIVGGIHGNEPGSYFAPSIFVKHYKITKNAVWIIPALNKQSIQKNARGIYGDMNRKFKYIKTSDKDYKKIARLKKIVLDDKVSMILNLHDGHGFFRPKYESTKNNQYAWGQTSVIDQKSLDKKTRFSNLYQIAQQVTQDINKNMHTNEHKFRIKNTKTKYQNKAQQNSLTYFAITHNKPAFAIETSKEIKDIATKVLYQLQAIESYMKVIGIEFERDFELNKNTINKLLNQFGEIQINNNIRFNAENIRPYIGFFPLKKKNNKFEFSNPLGSYSYSRKIYHLHIGNKHVASLKPDYFKMIKHNKPIHMQIDSRKQKVNIGSIVKVKKSFTVKAPMDIRVNVIGFGDRNDNFNTIYRKDIPTKYSLDATKKLFRIEFYKKSFFLGMVVVDFN